jgi:hypothetical protein
MARIKGADEEFQVFLKDFSLKPVAHLADENSFEKCSANVKRIFIWGIVIKKCIWKGNSKDAPTYFSEFASDTTLSVFLAFIGLYKISNAALWYRKLFEIFLVGEWRKSKWNQGRPFIIF